MFQLYPPKTRFWKKDGWQYAPMHLIFGVKHYDLRHKDRLVFGGVFVDSTEHNTYSSTIKYVSVRLILFIAVKNGLVIMAGDIGNSLCTAPCPKNIWS